MAKRAPVRKVVRKGGGEKTKDRRRPSANRRPSPATNGPTDLKRQLKIQKALYEIADAASAVKEMQVFYRKMHTIVGKLMYAENFFIALYDEQTDLITWPYHADVKNTDDASWSPQPLSQFKGGTAYIIRTGKSSWMARDFDRALKLGAVEVAGTLAKDAIGIPLMQGKKVLGVILVQSYSDEFTYTEQDERVLIFVAQHITTALTRLRALEAERQRTDELAILNSVGDAMAKTLDVKTVTRIVGDKVRDIFQAESVAISLLDEKTNLIHVQYHYEQGEGGHIDYIEPFPLGKGLTTKVIKTRQPLLLGTDEEQTAHGGYRAPGSEKLSNTRSQSAMLVPIIVKDKVIGVAHVANQKQNYFSENNLSLLQTLSANMGVAIQNARLFEAEQERVAELQIINSIQQGLAAELDFQAIVDLVGDKLREVFNTPDLYINWHDAKTNLASPLYYYEHGVRHTIAPYTPAKGGIFETMIKTRRPVVWNNPTEYKTSTIPGTDQSKSMASVPIISSDRVIGNLQLENFERENAYGESELRLLTTIAASLGTALENARLFDETQQRNAELAVINAVQSALAAELDIQAIYDAVGEKLREIFDFQTVAIYSADLTSDVMHMEYAFEKGKKYPRMDAPLNSLYKHVLNLDSTFVRNGDFPEFAAEFKDYKVPQGEMPKSILVTPVIRKKDSDYVVIIGLLDIDSGRAFSDTDIRLVETVANAMSVALKNARLFDEVQKKNAVITESLERETASNNILQVIAESPTDIQPVLDVIARNAAQLSGSDDALISLRDGDILRVDAHYGDIPMLPIGEGIRFNRDSVAGRAMIDGQPRQWIHNPRGVKSEYLAGDKVAKQYGYRMTCAVPLMREGKAIGCISIRRTRPELLTEKQIALVQSFANQAAIAVENVRLFEAEQQRVAELQIINSVQEGLASKLEMQAICDLVGNKISEVFKTDAAYIALYDHETNQIQFPYVIDDQGKRYDRGYEPLSTGFSAYIIKTKAPLVINQEYEKRLAELELGSRKFNPEHHPQAGLGAPMMVGTNVVGVVALFSSHENAFSDSDVRLLQTLANSMSVALENARLFDETQRLLKQTEQRAAELQIINNIGQTITGELDLNVLIEHVGDKLREAFNVGNIRIAVVDEKTGLMISPYVYRYGKRVKFEENWQERAERYKLAMRASARTGLKTWVVNTDAEKSWRKFAIVRDEEDTPKSFVMLPLLAGKEVIGGITIPDYEKENAFTDFSIGMLETIAANMGTAIQNIRLFNETQSLLKETEQRAAELQIINSIQQGLAAELDFQAIVDLVGDKIREIFNAQAVVLATFDTSKDLMYRHYVIEKGQRLYIEPRPIPNGWKDFIQNRQTWWVNTDFKGWLAERNSFEVPEDEMPKSVLSVPLVVGSRYGAISLQNLDSENAFSESDVRLLETLANSLSVALQNAQSFKAEQERVAELAIINSIQQGLAAELNFQAIIDLVGDKLRQTFNTGDISIAWYDARTQVIQTLYSYEHGQRFPPEPPTTPRSRAWLQIVATRQPLVLNSVAAQEAMGITTVPGTDQQKSMIRMPIIASDQIMGMIDLFSHERENAYSDADVRLLQTVTTAMGVALENARLFDETQRLLKETEERNAELAVINSVQAGLVARMDIQGIYDLVGDKIREIFAKVESVLIFTYDRQANLFQVHYGMTEIRTYDLSKMEDKRFFHYFDETKKTLLINENLTEAAARYGIYDLGDPAKVYELADADNLNTITYGGSALFVPLLVGSEVKGFFSLQDSKRENAFNDSDVRLLETLANSMSVALESARLFDETQRLLKITEERNAELAIINSVQAALAAELNIQGIYEAVGDKIRGIFHNRDMGIRIFDPKTNLLHFPYAYESGERIKIDSTPLTEKGFTPHVLRTRETLVINEKMEEAVEKYGSFTLPGTQVDKSAVYVPLVVGDQARGLISLNDVQREHAFSESDVRLLQTLANSMSVALENARLFDETQRLLKITEDRAAELAIINSVQAGLASKLDMQAIYDLVGDQIQSMFNAQSLIICSFDHEKYTTTVPYAFENGGRILDNDIMPFSPLHRHLIETRQPVVINENSREESKRYGLVIIEGTQLPKSLVYVPFGTGTLVNGYFSLQNMEHEHAFAESDVRLLQTLAGSMGIALENARLFNAEQQRNAELAIINSVQASLAAKLEMQAIYDAVGDKIREIFDAQVVMIVTHDKASDLAQFSYAIEKGERLYIDSRPVGGITGYVIRTGQTVLINQNLAQREIEILGTPAIIPAGDDIKSRLDVPMMVGTEVKGCISLQNVDRENAFSESDLRLLTTLSNSMSVALESARLFDETQRLLKETEQRAAELAIINSVQEGLASKLDMQAIYDLIGDKLGDILHTHDIDIRLFDAANNLVHYPYVKDKGVRIKIEPTILGGMAKYVYETKQMLVVNEDLPGFMEKVGSTLIPGTQMEKSFVALPIQSGGDAIGMVSISDYEKEHAFSDADLRLLQTVVSSMSVALENARLFDETQRLLKETEQRNAELAIVNSVQFGLASKLDMQAIFELVGEKIRTIFDAQSTIIATYEYDKEQAVYRYVAEKGERFDGLTMPFNGFHRKMIQERKTILYNENLVEQVRALGFEDSFTDAELPKSALNVPLLAGNQALGHVALENLDHEHAFNDSDVRLLETLANSMSVALESARLFDETQRLLKETEERNAELAVINSVQQGLASKLEFQSIINLVGDKVTEIFNAQAAVISLYNSRTDQVEHRYAIERGELLTAFLTQPVTIDKFRKRVVETKQSWLINQDYLRIAAELDEATTLEGDEPKSLLFVPMIVGNEVKGIISLQNMDVENAFTESDVRLLQTLANAMSVSLESARLFDETQRLLKETEQRAAELAIINSVQQGLASKLDMQAIYDLVGNKIFELFSLQTCYIMIYDKEKNIEHYPFLVDNGKRITQEDLAHDENGFGPLVMKTRQPIMINEDMEGRSKEVNSYNISDEGDTVKAAIYVPLLIGNEARGVISVQNTQREHAYTESDLRLMTTLASSMSVALESARLFAETEQRAAELATVNTVSSALASELDISALINLVGEQARTIFRADIAYVALLDQASSTINFPYTFGEELNPLRLGEGLTSRIIETGKPLLINEDVDRETRDLGATVVGVVAQSYLGVPIFVSGRAAGVVSVQSTSRHGVFNQDDERLLSTIAANVGSALHNAQLYKDAQESRAAAEQANKAKSAFLANMSHELRTPLNAIIGFTRIVRRKAEGTLPGKQTDNLDKVLSSAEHLLNLINTVLDIAKIEAGRMEVQASNFSISALADLCANTAAPLLKPGVLLEKEIDPALTIVHSDQDKIKQIILNLMSNAAKFTHEGRIVLRVRRVDADLVVDVVDSGIGISEEALGRIFEEFQQADTSTTRQYGGTGLGLAISRNLARLLGGDLTAGSEVGRGSKFTLTIPMQYGFRSVTVTKPEPETTPKATHLLRADASKKLILVIDDDPDAVYLLQENLSAEEFEVVGTRNGLEGQQMARDLLPQAILLDIIMPDKDGWQVLHDLKADEQTKDIPVILLTIVDKKALGFQLGASAYLLKPLDPAAVQDALKRVTIHNGNGQVHVLVVDDDPHVADMLRQSLPETTFKLESAEDGVAGLQAIEAHRPDVVLLDIMMPRLDGFGVIEQLRANEATRDLPIIVISAKELTDEEMKTLEERVNFVMKKQGFDGEMLMQEINSVLEK